MLNGDDLRIRRWLAAGAAAAVVAGGVAGCTPAKPADKPAAPGLSAAAATPSADAPKHFGPAGWGKLTPGISEQEALASGDLQTAPVSTVLHENVYSYVGGPKPDPKRMAADAAIEKRVAAADKLPKSASAAELAKATQAYADSAGRIADRLKAYLDAGGATFKKGTMVSLAPPKEATTESGIKRGSTLADVKAAYQAQGLKSTSKDVDQVPVPGHDDWRLQFEFDHGKVLYMTLINTK
jgi:hypothetical protein